MVEAFSRGAGPLMFGVGAGAVLFAIGFMGWALYAVGAVALAVLVAALLLFVLEMTADYPYCPSSARRCMWAATAAAAVLVVVVLVI